MGLFTHKAERVPGENTSCCERQAGPGLPGIKHSGPSHWNVPLRCPCDQPGGNSLSSGALAVPQLQHLGATVSTNCQF